MKGNVTDIQQADEAFRNQNDTRMESRSCGEKPFNRWAWWMSERGGWTSAPKAVVVDSCGSLEDCQVTDVQCLNVQHSVSITTMAIRRP